MKDLFYRTTPAYRGCATPTTSPGILSGFWCALFGGSAPAYRGQRVPAPSVSRCWWQAIPSAPDYKSAATGEPSTAEIVPAPGEPASGDDNVPPCGSYVRDEAQVVPTEIHIW